MAMGRTFDQVGQENISLIRGVRRGASHGGHSSSPCYSNSKAFRPLLHILTTVSKAPRGVSFTAFSLNGGGDVPRMPTGRTVS